MSFVSYNEDRGDNMSKKYLMEARLQAWLKGVIIKADSPSEAIEKMQQMTLQELTEAGGYMRDEELDSIEYYSTDRSENKENQDISWFCCYESAILYLLQVVEDNHCPHYEIVEDSLKVDYGLLLIPYDENGEEMDEHILVQYNPNPKR